MALQERVEKIVNILDEKKGDAIEVFNLEQSDYIAKAVILVNSLGGKHTSALADHIRTNAKALGELIIATDESDDWIVMDLEDILIHIMTPQYRMRYSIESFLQELKEGKFKPSEQLQI